MAKNGGESRIPVAARTVRPSLLPKLRPTKISSIGHRRSPGCCNNGSSNNKHNKNNTDSKLPKPLVRLTPDSDKEHLLDQDYSISSIWNVTTTDNRQNDHLIRMNDENLGLLCSQEDLSNSKKFNLQSRENLNLINDGIESPSSQSQQQYQQPPPCLMLTKQNSFEHDESSLGILTPDQMTDFTVALDSSRTPSCENLTGQGKFHLNKSNAVVAAAARHLDIAIRTPSLDAPLQSNDRSPSIEDLPLDPKPVIVIEEDVELLESILRSAEALGTSDLNSLDITEPSLSKTLLSDSAETSEHTTSAGETSTTRCSATSSNSTVGSSTNCVIGCINNNITNNQVLPTSFITSVTSIASLEAGYQGDGENSRPASRGPEPIGIATVSNLVSAASAICSRQDPMTDSDFFTESDADAHDADIGRGDRRAQVIDGRLFCPPSMATSSERGGVRCLEPAEEMDSSGIYSDLEKRDVKEMEQDNEHTTTDTGDTEVSMKSQMSPVDCKPVPALSSKNLLTPLSNRQQESFNETIDSNTTVATAEVTVIKCQKNEQNSAMKSKSNNLSNKENSAPIKKHKMPKRNVISKIKTMIESTQKNVKEEKVNEPHRPRKPGRWDAVCNKIDYASKLRGRSFKKEVQSRVLQGLGTSTGSSTASTSSSVRRTVGDANNNGSINKDKRKGRGRLNIDSPSQDTGRSASVRSSASDLSSVHSKEAASLKRPRKTCTDLHNQVNNQLIRTNSNINKPNHPTVRKVPSIKSVQPSLKQKNGTISKEHAREPIHNQQQQNQQQKSTMAPVTTLVVSNERNNRAKEAILNNNNNNNHVVEDHHHNNNHHNRHTNNLRNHLLQHHNNGQQQQQLQQIQQQQQQHHQQQQQQIQQNFVKPDTKEQEVQATLLKPDDWPKNADITVQALSIAVQYFTHQLEQSNDNCYKRTLEKMKSEWLNARAEIKALQDELDREQTEKSSLEYSISEERRRAEVLESSLQEREAEQRTILERIRNEYEIELNEARNQIQQVQTPRNLESLLNEVESLRTVLEIRSKENTQLRSEVDLLRRELDDKEMVKMKCEQMEARCEDLTAQLQSKEDTERQLSQENEVMRGSIHQLSKQNKRLSQRNEELLWRLRQKNEVVNVLTHQLTPTSQRLSKSLGPEHTPEHPSTNSEQDCTSKSDNQHCSMKYMIEKSDSVSWTLDITESSDGGSICNKTPSPANRRSGVRDSNGTLVARQSSLRLTSQRKINQGYGRARSNSVSTSDTKSANTSATHGAHNEESDWSPSYNSTPLRRSMQPTPANEQAWSLPDTVAEDSSTTTSGITNSNNCKKAKKMKNNLGGKSSGNKKLIDLSTTDEDDEEDEEEEEEDLGQRPQEAGGEAMISEVTSTSSSSEDDESSVSSGDIP